jgi:hypothetical protein
MTSITLPIHILATRPPEEFRMRRHHLGTRRDAVDHQGAEQQRHGRAAGNTKRQRGDEVRLRGRIVGRFRPGDAFDRALAEAGRILGELPFKRVGGEGGYGLPRSGRTPRMEPMPVPRRMGFHDAFRSLPRRHEVGHPPGQDFAFHRDAEIDDDFREGKEAGGDDDEIKTLGKAIHAEGEAVDAGIDVRARQSQDRAAKRHAHALDERAAHEGGRTDQGHEHQREILRRAELQRHGAKRRPDEGDEQRADAAGDDRADGGDGQSRSPRAPAAPSGIRRCTSPPRRIRPED